MEPAGPFKNTRGWSSSVYEFPLIVTLVEAHAREGSSAATIAERRNFIST
jgi:hypothetical protein